VLPPGPVLPVHLEFSVDMLNDALRAARLSLLSWIFRRPVMLDQLDTAQVAKQDILGG
jgi:hypothetical protein